MMKKTAVLIHGCHLQADQNGSPWEAIVWGLDSDGLPTLRGRGTMGLKVAFDNDAELVIFSTGASERDGLKEGEYTRNWAMGHIDELAKMTGWHDMPEGLEQFIGVRGELDLESQNTREECERNFRLCAEHGIERVFIVSSPWHIQRCHTEALKVAEAMRAGGEDVPEIIAVASHGSTEGLVILEPLHRGDMPKTIWHLLGVRFFRIKEAARASFEQGLNALLVDHNA